MNNTDTPKPVATQLPILRDLVKECGSKPFARDEAIEACRAGSKASNDVAGKRLKRLLDRGLLVPTNKAGDKLKVPGAVAKLVRSAA